MSARDDLRLALAGRIAGDWPTGPRHMVYDYDAIARHREAVGGTLRCREYADRTTEAVVIIDGHVGIARRHITEIAIYDATRSAAVKAGIIYF